jgi:hypothetical protein
MALAVSGNFYVLRSGLRTRPPPQHETDWPNPIALAHSDTFAVADTLAHSDTFAVADTLAVADTFAVADTLAVADADPHSGSADGDLDQRARLRLWKSGSAD